MGLSDWLRRPDPKTDWDSERSAMPLNDWWRYRDPREQAAEDHINDLWDKIREQSSGTQTPPAARQRDRFGRFVRRGG